MIDPVFLKKCLHCGTVAEDAAAVCPKCSGTEFTETREYVRPYSPSLAASLTPKGREIYERLYGGDLQAMCEYGLMLYAAKEGAWEDLKEAYEWYLCAARNGYADGFYWAGSMHCNGDIMWEEDCGNFKDGVYLLKAGAKRGSVRCMSALGQYYLMGYGVNANDTLAHRYLCDAAAAGDEQSMRLAARCYLEGSHGFEHDPEKAKELYIKADALSYMYSDLRNAYLADNGLSWNAAEAEEVWGKYLQEILRLYITDPQKDVTCSYAWLIGREYLERDDEETAAEWFKKAMESGDISGKIELQHLKKTL